MGLVEGQRRCGAGGRDAADVPEALGRWGRSGLGGGLRLRRLWRRVLRSPASAARRGQPSLTLTFAARGATLCNAVFPNLTGYVIKIGNRFLPAPRSQDEGNNARAGHQAKRTVPGWMTELADRASPKNNELQHSKSSNRWAPGPGSVERT